MPQEEEAGGGCDEVLTILLTGVYKKQDVVYKKKRDTLQKESLNTATAKVPRTVPFK